METNEEFKTKMVKFVDRLDLDNVTFKEMVNGDQIWYKNKVGFDITLSYLYFMTPSQDIYYHVPEDVAVLIRPKLNELWEAYENDKAEKTQDKILELIS